MPVTIVQLDHSTIVVDFGTNLTGMMKMKFYGLEKGQKIIMHYAELDARDPNEAWRLGGERAFHRKNYRKNQD